MPKSVEEVRFIIDGGRLSDVLEPISLGVSRFGSVAGIGESPSSEGVVRPEKLISKGRRGVGRSSGGPSSDILKRVLIPEASKITITGWLLCECRAVLSRDTQSARFAMDGICWARTLTSSRSLIANHCKKWQKEKHAVMESVKYPK
jgi:hypothetical protein